MADSKQLDRVVKMSLENEVQKINSELDSISDRIWKLVAENEDIKEDNIAIQKLENSGNAIDGVRVKLTQTVAILKGVK